MYDFKIKNKKIIYYFNLNHKNEKIISINSNFRKESEKNKCNKSNMKKRENNHMIIKFNKYLKETMSNNCKMSII